MNDTKRFCAGEIYFPELLCTYRQLLVAEDPQSKAEFDTALKEHHMYLLGAIFGENVLAGPLLVENRELQMTVCIMIAQFCKTLRPDYLNIIAEKSFMYLMASPQHIAALYSSIIYSYARALALAGTSFQEPPPVKLLLELIENESELIPQLLETLATCAIFDSVKIQLVAQYALQRLAPRLAATENAKEACGVLGLIHSLCFNLTDVLEYEDYNERYSVFDMVAPVLKEIYLSALLDAILEKDFKESQEDVAFNVLMILHGCLMPHTKDLASLKWVYFAIKQVNLKSDISIQVVCETAVKIIAIVSKEERNYIADFIADDIEFIRKVFAFLEISSNFSVCGMITSLLQVVAAHCSLREQYISYPFTTLPLIHYAHRLAYKLAYSPLETIISQLESCYYTVLYFTESRCPYKWPYVALAVESRNIIYLARSLSAVYGLLSELRGITGLVGVLCGYDDYLFGVFDDLKGKPGEFELIFKFLMTLCVDIKKHQAERGYVVIVNILKGLSKYKQYMRLIDPQEFVYLIECFKIDLSEEYDDVLMDLVEGFGDTCPDTVIEQIQTLMDQLGGK